MDMDDLLDIRKFAQELNSQLNDLTREVNDMGGIETSPLSDDVRDTVEKIRQNSQVLKLDSVKSLMDLSGYKIVAVPKDEEEKFGWYVL